jgi:hypothetical protein
MRWNHDTVEQRCRLDRLRLTTHRHTETVIDEMPPLVLECIFSHEQEIIFFGLSKLNFRFAGLQNCRIALRLRCNACTISSRLPTCSLWLTLANFLLGITMGLGVGVHAEITEYFDNTWCKCNCTLLGSHSRRRKKLGGVIMIASTSSPIAWAWGRQIE